MASAEMRGMAGGGPVPRQLDQRKKRWLTGYQTAPRRVCFSEEEEMFSKQPDARK